MRFLESWTGKIVLSRRAKRVFPVARSIAGDDVRGRFAVALETARSAYMCIRGNTDHSDFVHAAWIRNLEAAENYFLDEFGMDFIEDAVINGTMVFTNRDAHAEEWAYLSEWRSFDELIDCIRGRESAAVAGARQRIAVLINSAHHLYHIARYERATGAVERKPLAVAEFGGGYGNLARVFRNFAKPERYVILDLPLFSCIQYVYLSTVFGPENVRLECGAGKGIGNGSIILVPLPFIDSASVKCDLFVSTWALSESSERAYTYVKNHRWFGAASLLLAYSDNWKPWVDDELKENLRSLGHEVRVESIPFLPGNNYLFTRSGRSDFGAMR